MSMEFWFYSGWRLLTGPSFESRTFNESGECKQNNYRCGVFPCELEIFKMINVSRHSSIPPTMCTMVDLVIAKKNNIDCARFKISSAQYVQPKFD